MDEDNNGEHTNNLNNNNPRNINSRNHNDRNGESQSRVDTSSNTRHQRPDINSSRFRRQRYYSQYHINQFYDAAEDEQFYTDEYASLMNTYGNFISNSNAMFARFESGLRGSIARSINRQYFYYNRYNQIVNDPSPPSSMVDTDTVAATPNMASGPSVPSGPPTAPSTNATTASRRIARSLLDAINNEFNLRIPTTDSPTTNRRLQPYAFFFDLTAADISGNNLTNNNNNNNNNNNLNNIFNNRRESNIPTTQQIQIATINTRYSSITAPTNNICPISRDEFNDNSAVTQIRGCTHIFNRTSLNEWFRAHSTCPMCRYDIRDYNRNSNNSNNTNNNRPDLATLNSIINNNNNTYDIYNRIIDNSANFMNTIINNMTDDEITFSYDIPPSFNHRNIYRYNDDNDNAYNDNAYNDNPDNDNDDIEEVD